MKFYLITHITNTQLLSIQKCLYKLRGQYKALPHMKTAALRTATAAIESFQLNKRQGRPNTQTFTPQIQSTTKAN